MSYLLAQDEFWMQQALTLAEQAKGQGEVPVGAVLVQENCVVAQAHNATIVRCDPTAHAEMLVLRHGALQLNTCHLKVATLYVTLEPCPMCFGAIMQSQIKRVVFGAYDTQSGAAGSAFNLLQKANLLWRPDVVGGICEKPAADLLRLFFQKRR